MAVLVLTRVASAQWTAIVLHPAGAAESRATGVAGGQQVGFVRSEVNGPAHASLWSGTAASWVSLQPTGNESALLGIAGGEQCGYSALNGYTRAGTWTGSADSFSVLAESTSPATIAYGVSAGQQVGTVTISGSVRASLWAGTPASWTDLTPSWASSSAAYATDGAHQVGYSTDGGRWRASLWTGAAGTWTDLSPTWSQWDSASFGVADGEEVGYAVLPSGYTHASLWRGTPDSWIDLNPANATSSKVYAVSGQRQVGEALVDGVLRACIWNETPETWTDLHGFLPAGYIGSSALAVWGSGTAVYVAGYATSATTGRDEAVLWSACRPQIVQQPGNVSATPCDTARFSVTAIGPGPLTFRWRRYGTPLNDNSRISGSHTATLTIHPVGYFAGGDYDVIVANSCGQTASHTATLYLRDPADFNGDGDTGTDADVEAFFACLAGSCCPACGSADFNGDGDIGTDADIESFFRVLAGGAC